jgi:hypothetical protein
MLHHYQVTIRYREPSYEHSAGRKAEPYRWTFEIDSADHDGARRSAVSQFREMERLSSVGWIREIEQVDVRIRDRPERPRSGHA